MLGTVAAQAGHPARVEMKSAVVVQVGPGDSADNAYNREVMANHDYGFFGSVTLHDSIQSLPGPPRDIHEPLAAWNLGLCRLGSPFLNKLRVVLLNLSECQAFQFAMIKFANVVLDEHGKVMMQTEEPSGLLRALQIA
jgi:hypothetical protein